MIHVFGPAYLDRVVLVDRPLHDDDAPPLDQSVDGDWKFGVGLRLVDPDGGELTVGLPEDWPGPNGEVRLSRSTGRPIVGALRVNALSWHDDLGGMGAGYAAALGGELVSALGPIHDPMSLAVETRLKLQGIRHRPIRIADHAADWTLLVTSGPFGDKLPVGFRGCHAAIERLDPIGDCDLRVVASFPNRLAAEALRMPGAKVRMFAPSMRNMTDREHPVERFVEFIDLLCCNRHEWESLEGREHVAWQVSVLAVTDGADGALIRYTTPEGEAARLQIPVFPRSRPPRDTNRAGEAFAATLLGTLLQEGWKPAGGASPDLIRLAALRASASAALVLDRAEFGFPSPSEIDEAILVGKVNSSTDGASDGSGYNAIVSVDPEP